MMTDLRVVFIFVDGLGVGEKNPEFNPCTADTSGIFLHFRDQRNEAVPFGGIGISLDATLGVPGLPQSATGQTTLLTGVNAAKLLGEHRSGFPNKTLREMLKQKSLLKQVKEAGKRAAFLNAYRPIFFKLDDRLKWLLSTTTVANLSADLPFFTLEDVVEHRAIYQDFTNKDLIRKGFDVPEFTPEEAGEILAEQTARYDFILYEYFKTDRAGHSQDFGRAAEEIRKLGRFLLRFLSEIDLKTTQVILTSDHGNMEDLRVKTHTRNPAMTILWGPLKEEWAQTLSSLEDVTPAILKALL
ncbi:MAG: peptidase [Calditrichaeota bacterium]|nr:peptidase [Calditrichota bacterium]